MIETEIYSALKELVEDRVYPITFYQGDDLPEWPAIRYQFVSVIPGEDICGSGGDETAEIHLQIDAVDEEFDGMRELRLEIMAAMDLFAPPAILESTTDEYDAETKTFRSILSYVLHPSSVGSGDGESLYADGYADDYA